MGIAHLRYLARVVGALAVVATIGAASPAFGALSEGTDCQAQPANTCLGDPFDVKALPGALGSPASPEEDLAAALADLKGAADPDAAAQAQGRALAIIEGSTTPLVATDKAFLDRKAYAGIPLLNTRATPPKTVQEVPQGTTSVDIREVRFGDHAILDTSMLRFADMDTPFTINWHITELGTSFGGELAPVGVPGNGPAKSPMLAQLGLPTLDMGTTAVSRFHPATDPAAGRHEVTRLATQVFQSISMPAPSALGGGILDPNLKAGHETFAQVAVGSATADPPSLPGPDGVTEWSAVGQLHADLGALPTGDVAAANALGAKDAPLVPAMASRDTLPAPDRASPTADVNVEFANAEAYADARNVRVAPGGQVTFSVSNLDAGVTRHFDVRQLHNRSQVAAQGVLSWGAFDSDVLGAGIDLAPGETKTLTVTPAGDAFSLWVGDPHGGSQAAMAIALDRGPRKQSLELGLGPVKPLHQALDADGNLWVSLANTDEVARLTPTADSLSAAKPKIFPLPGGIADKPPPAGTPAVAPVLGPGDVQVDGHGIVWVTLGAGNAIARIDPTLAKEGTTAGITIFT